MILKPEQQLSTLKKSDFQSPFNQPHIAIQDAIKH